MISNKYDGTYTNLGTYLTIRDGKVYFRPRNRDNDYPVVVHGVTDKSFGFSCAELEIANLRAGFVERDTTYVVADDFWLKQQEEPYELNLPSGDSQPPERTIVLFLIHERGAQLIISADQQGRTRVFANYLNEPALPLLLLREAKAYYGDGRWLITGTRYDTVNSSDPEWHRQELENFGFVETADQVSYHVR